MKKCLTNDDSYEHKYNVLNESFDNVYGTSFRNVFRYFPIGFIFSILHMMN